MKWLVTGHAGFIGSHLYRRLSKLDLDVIGVDRKSGPAADLSRPEIIDRLASNRPDVIFHLASSCSTPGSVSDPLGTFNDTVVTAASIMEVARRCNSVVILTSSVKARDGMTPYGASKQMVEIWAKEYAAAYGIDLVINRPGTVYGPGQAGSTESGWIAWFLRAMNEGLTVTINGDGSQVRDLLYVDDYVDLMIAQARNYDLYRDRIWDVGGGERNAVTVLEMAKYLGLDFVFGPSRYGDANNYVGVNDAPGWEPKTYWRTSETLR